MSLHLWLLLIAELANSFPIPPNLICLFCVFIASELSCGPDKEENLSIKAHLYGHLGFTGEKTSSFFSLVAVEREIPYYCVLWS